MRLRVFPWARYAAALVVILLPCFWQSRIVAGDLSSHIYNAWLAELIAEGRAPGLTEAHQHTNVLFDWILSALMALTSPAAAQKVATACAVLVFVSGAFSLIVQISGRRDLYPLFAVAILAYGYVFRMGLMNFYLSLGLCFWAVSLAWRGNARRLALSAALLALAWVAHLLPVLWAAGVITYVRLASRLSARGRLVALGSAIAGLSMMALAARWAFLTRWDWTQAVRVTGAEQAWTYDDKYMAITLGLLAVWAHQFLGLARRCGAHQVAASMPFHVYALSAAIVVAAPTAVQGETLFAVFIADRMSLPVAVCLVALLAQQQPRGPSRFTLPAVTALFFLFSYIDERVLVRMEERIERATRRLPEGSRVLSVISLGAVRIEPLRHVADRACLGRCYSYANYEPSTGEFRVRATGPNSIVTAHYADSLLMQEGGYTVKRAEAPLFLVDLDDGNQVVVRRAQAGDRVQQTVRRLLPCVFC